jgi:hypothetical protein
MYSYNLPLRPLCLALKASSNCETTTDPIIFSESLLQSSSPFMVTKYGICIQLNRFLALYHYLEMRMIK